MTKKLVTTLALAAAAVAFAGATLAAPASYDGTWSVRLVTEAGSCDPSYSYTVAIADGAVRPLSGGASGSISGGVRDDGRVSLGIQRSIARADAFGRLRSSSGSGTWSVAMLGCTGRWTAQRRA